MVNTLIRIKAATYQVANYRDDQLTGPLPPELGGIFSRDVGQVIMHIEEQLFGYVQESARKAYLTDVQFHLTELADQLTAFDREGRSRDTVAVLFRTMADKAVAVLSHLFEHFTGYIDLEGKLPVGYTSGAGASDLVREQGIIAELRTMEIDPDLIEVLSAYVLNRSTSNLYPLHTWQQWQYLQKTIGWLEQFTQLKPPIKPECRLQLELIGRNFNSIRIYAYFLRYIARVTQDDRPFQDQQQDLLYFLKVLRQVLVDPAYTYDANVQPLKQSLIDCLTAELEYVGQREKVLTDHYRSTVESPSKFYFDVAVTLGELMFLIKVWLEISFIHTRFKSYVYEFISNHIHTKRAENLSKKSMRNHLSSSYLPDRMVLNVRDWLSKMIAHIDLHYKN